jgi:hypothetical protein
MKLNFPESSECNFSEICLVVSESDRWLYEEHIKHHISEKVSV